MILIFGMILLDFEDLESIFGPILDHMPTGITLAPSWDESLPVRFQEPQTDAVPVQPKSYLSPSVPLGMEFILHRK